MHTLLFYQPAHFHAALLIRSQNPRLAHSIHVYATPGPDLDRFTALVASFNARDEQPTDWDLEVHTSSDPLTRLIDERKGDSVVVAGRNAPKLATIRKLHDAGLNVLADKPWITTSAALDDLHHVTAGPPLVMDIMTDRHDTASRLRRHVVATEPVFGQFVADSSGAPGLELDALHHLCKLVDGHPLRRPEWYYDVRVQGNGLVDIQSHMVDQAQWLIDEGDAAGDRSRIPSPLAPQQPIQDMVLEEASLWSTAVPLSVFTESTGATAFPPSLRSAVSDGVLDLTCNGQIEYRLRGVRVTQRSVWRAASPTAGGDTHRSVARGTGAHVTLEQGPETGHRPQVHVGQSDDGRLADRLAGSLDGWKADFPGLSLRPSRLGYELAIPSSHDTPHELTFPLVLDDFLDRVEGGRWSPSTAAAIRARYTLLARAHELAG